VKKDFGGIFSFRARISAAAIRLGARLRVCARSTSRVYEAACLRPRSGSSFSLRGGESDLRGGKGGRRNVKIRRERRANAQFPPNVKANRRKKIDALLQNLHI